MLDDLLASLDPHVVGKIQDAINTLDAHEVFQFILRKELSVLANSVESKIDPTEIHHLIISYKARIALVQELKLLVKQGD